MLQRIFNIEYDPDLVFAHMILKMTHDNFSHKILTPDSVIPLKQEHIDSLYQLSKEFGDRIEKNQSFDDVLRQFAILTYSIGGNGYYLAHKGVLTV